MFDFEKTPEEEWLENQYSDYFYSALQKIQKEYKCESKAARMLISLFEDCEYHSYVYNRFVKEVDLEDLEIAALKGSYKDFVFKLKDHVEDEYVRAVI